MAADSPGLQAREQRRRCAADQQQPGGQCLPDTLRIQVVRMRKAFVHHDVGSLYLGKEFAEQRQQIQTPQRDQRAGVADNDATPARRLRPIRVRRRQVPAQALRV